jgi:hypothetical protein
MSGAFSDFGGKTSMFEVINKPSFNKLTIILMVDLP